MGVLMPTRFQGESAEAFLDRLMPILSQEFDALTTPGALQSTIFDQQGRPMVSPFGVYAYNAGGGIPVSPDIVQIDTQDIVDAAIVTAKLGDLAVSTAKIGDGVIVTAKIGDLAVTTAKIDDLAVNNAKIANATIGSAKIQNAAITNALIANAAVGTAQIQAAAITNALIANAAIGSAQIQNLAVQNAHIDNLTVGTAKIANNAVTELAFTFDNSSSVATAAAETTIVSTTITTTGSPVIIRGSGHVEVFSTGGPTDQAFAQARIKRGSTNITNQQTCCVSNAGLYDGGAIGIAIVDQPAAGTYTYNLTLQNAGNFDHGFRTAVMISAEEIKK